LSEKTPKDPIRILASDVKFFWNINLYEIFKDQNIDHKWYTPLIQGYIGIINGKLDGEEL
jgi:hypothetical protein